MNALHIFNAVLLALSATFAVTLSVVCLLYALNLDASPRMPVELASLAKVTAVFWVQALVGLPTFIGQRRVRSWRWIAQAVFVAVLVLGYALIRAILD